MANEKRLIDADALIEFIDVGHLRNPLERCYSEQDVVDMLESRPTVDAVEVVRCKDCKHGVWDEDEGLWRCVYDAEFDEKYGEYFGFCEYNDGLHFCSYGERRD